MESYRLKSDQNGIEISFDFDDQVEYKLKSDQNGIEMIQYQHTYADKRVLKSDQNGIEILTRTAQTGQYFLRVKIRPKWD